MAQRHDGRHEIYDVDASIMDGNVIEASATRNNEAMHQPRLPSGQIIDSKNTLQSFHVPIPNDVQVVPASAHNNEAMNQPTLPNGQIVDSKNTLQSFPVPIPTAFVVESRSNADTAGANNTGNNEAPSSPIVEGILVPNPFSSGRTKSFWWWLMVTLAMISALVVTGVCASGKCSANSDPTITEILTSIPTMSPRLSPRTVASLSPSFRPVSTPPTLNSTFDPSMHPSVSPTFHPSMRPTLTPESALVEQAVTSFINNITFSKEEIVVNGTNPESRAVTWLIYGDDMFNTSALLTLDFEMETEVSFRIRQRYVLATLWFQQADESGAFVNSWRNITGWLDYRNECDWFGIICESIDLGENVGFQYVVTEIRFYDELLLLGNNLYGTFPPDIGQMTLLTHLDFSVNLVLGTLPESIAQCSRLEIISLFDCLMDGTLPSSVGLLTNMVTFDVTSNDFFGTLPNSTALWSNLTFFSVRSNRISGSFPDFIEAWTVLDTLRIGVNSFAGTIPEFVGRLTTLVHLEFSSNEFNGTLPPSIGKLASMRFFDGSENMLEGPIPSSTANWSQIEYARFDGNQFAGSVPAELCQTNGAIFVDCEVNCTCCQPVDSVNCG